MGLVIADGKLIKRLEARRTHVEWLRSLEQIDREAPIGLTIHVIADNYATHKDGRVTGWLADGPGAGAFHADVEFPGSTFVERFFADLTAGIRRGKPSAASPSCGGRSCAIWGRTTRTLDATGGLRRARTSQRRSATPGSTWPRSRHPMSIESMRCAAVPERCPRSCRNTLDFGAARRRRWRADGAGASWRWVRPRLGVKVVGRPIDGLRSGTLEQRPKW